jgi:uncharacterized protein (DUF2342 family)
VKKILIAAAALVASTVYASAPTTWDSLSRRYETIRVSLTKDSIAGISAEAKAIDAELAKAEKKLDAAAFGTTDAKAVKTLIPQLRLNVQKVAAAKNIAEARDAFGALSTNWIAMRKVASGAKGHIAYCSMANKAWVQPTRELGNPYYGSSMLRCGEIIADR